MTEHNPHLIEHPVRFSNSKLWGILQNYFTSMGVKAWQEEVPFYISSNAFVGHRYALLVVHFIMDWQKAHPQNKDRCFTIFEIGSGPGLFSFYFLKALKTLLSIYQLESQKFCYVISDLIEENITFCKENKAFAPYIEKGELDFALFNVAQDQDFHLMLKDKKYSEIANETPLVIIANYTFDCIKEDVFFCEKGKMQELKLGLHSRYKNFDTEKARHLSDLKFDYQCDNVDITHYYDDPILNDLLKHYQEKFKETDVWLMIPLGAIHFLKAMETLTQGKFFLISGDKGLSNEDAMPLLERNNIAAYDGCYSFFVNFHAMGTYLKKRGGDYLLSHTMNDFKVNLFAMGFQLSNMVETKGHFKNFLEYMGPDEYSRLYEEFQANEYRFAMRSLLGFLRLSQWDPKAYAIIHDRFMELYPVSEGYLESDIYHDLEKVEQNIYPIPIEPNVYHRLAYFYQSVELYDKAIALYEKSIAVFPKYAASYNNLAMIYEKKKNTHFAIENYEKTVSLNKNNVVAKRKITRLSGKPTLTFLTPLLKGMLVIGLLAFAVYWVNR